MIEATDDPPGATARTGARILVDQLLAQGSDLAFCVPGESYLPVLDALGESADEIRLVSCRNEIGAVNMAEAYGKLTGRPGVCLVTRGPGAMHAAIGLHTATQDSTPMILLIGQVPRNHLDREAFQELDYRRVFSATAKWVAQIDDPARIPEYMARAYGTAVSGRPGPVVLALPEDVLWEEADAVDTPRVDKRGMHPGEADLGRLEAMLRTAARPLLLVGGGGWSPEAKRDVEAFCAATGIPVATAFRCQDYVDNELEQYVGTVGLAVDPALAQRVRDADVLVVVGERLTESVTGGYTLLDIPRPRQRLVHVLPDPAEIGRVFHPELGIVAGAAEFAHAARHSIDVDGGPWVSWCKGAHADYLSNLDHEPTGEAVDLGKVFAFLRDRLTDDAILTSGAGNYTAWVHRFTRYRHYRTQLAPVSGAMGYGVPAAIAAKALHPDRMVVAFAGDGCFLMTGQELATAVQYDLPVIFVVLNNGSFGTIRMHQERWFPDRSYGTHLHNPDLAAFAESFGAHGEAVALTEHFPAAFDRAQASGLPAVIEVQVGQQHTLPHATLDDVRNARGDRRDST